LCLTLTFQLLALVANEGDPLEGFVSCSWQLLDLANKIS